MSEQAPPTKERIRAALDVLENYVGPDGKIDATRMTQEITRLRQRVAELEECCTRRGARMQKLFGWVKGKHSAEHFIQCFPEAANWFDEDGVPL